MSYKKSIKDELSKKHWEVIEIDNLGEWWEDEHWKIQWKHSQGLILYIQFLVDPMNIPNVWQIQAKLDIEKDNSEIASFSISKRKFNIKLEEFLIEIEDYRKNENKNTKQTF